MSIISAERVGAFVDGGDVCFESLRSFQKVYEETGENDAFAQKMQRVCGASRKTCPVEVGDRLAAVAVAKHRSRSPKRLYQRVGARDSVDWPKSGLNPGEDKIRECCERRDRMTALELSASRDGCEVPHGILGQLDVQLQTGRFESLTPSPRCVQRREIEAVYRILCDDVTG